MPVIKNMAQLRGMLVAKMSDALRLTQEDIYNVIQKHVTQYYNESFAPSKYKRTYQFMNGLVKTDISVSATGVSCEVKFSDLNYVQSAETVLNMINSGFHADPSLNGGRYHTPYAIEAEGKFWDDAIGELGGDAGIYNMLKKNLQSVGLPVK